MVRAVFCVAVITLGLAGCASSGAGTRPDAGKSDDVDTSKVATVNRWAIDHHAKLIWINYPQKKQTASVGTVDSVK